MNISFASSLTKHVFDFYYYNIEKFKLVWDRIMLILKEYLPDEPLMGFLKFYADEDGADFSLYVQTQLSGEQLKEIKEVIPQATQDLIDETIGFEIVIYFTDNVQFCNFIEEESEDD